MESISSASDLDNWFTYHPPRQGQQERYQAIRTAALIFARVVRETAPSSADQAAAIRKIREAVMTANAAIACETEPESAHYARRFEAKLASK